MRFRVLGPLAVLPDKGPEVALRSGNQRIVLSVLLSARGRPVSAERLIAAVWPAGPPRTAANSLQVAIHHLRQLFGDPARLTLGPGGYTLHVRPEEVDAEVFERQVAAGRLREALALWRGPAYDQVSDDPGVRAEAARLQEAWLTAVAARIDADLAAGQAAELVGELRHLVREHPARERFVGQLMTALDRSGRRAEAIEAYHDSRRALGPGVQPGAKLQKVLQALLDAELEVDGLPPAPAGFRGRQAELAELRALLRAGAVAISGRWGVGKSALAIRLAHLVRDDYPDGQLYGDLRAGDDVLGRFLAAFGAESPEEPAERAALFRSLVADRRVLVVLDNATTEAQVEPLLPGTPSCGVIVTSRVRLAGLPARQLDLAPLPERDALAVLATDRRDAAALSIVSLCERLPVALQAAHDELATRSVAGLAEALADPARRLGLLSPAGRGVRACLATGYDGLSPPVRSAFRRLAVLKDLTGETAAAALGIPSRAAGDILDQLVDVRLLDVEAGRYRYSELVRLFALEVS
ncbi:AfsR/SARP family transcriptional regulator [Fodinicola acaciae]|uniref:AfsR/SARP family transcriptional regulator n=1 Tax=Fodinicola acaciae TaxID=2681555 RepID=UPI0013D4A968|nr:BTAD domain-containing putative transcriptional regulator [Fodinicola acaciae]